MPGAWNGSGGEYSAVINNRLYELHSEETADVYKSGKITDVDTNFITDTMRQLIDKANEKNTDFKRIWEQSVGGDLDFKLQLDEHKLYLINGKLYDRNEAGNFIWAYFLASHNFDWLSGLLAEGGSLVTEQRPDETWDRDAREQGQEQYKRDTKHN